MKRLTDVWYNSIWSWIGLAGILTAIAFFVSPGDARATTKVLSPVWAYAWNIMYGIGGLTILLGEVRANRRDLSFTGLFMLAVGILVNTVAVIASTGVGSSTIIPINLALVVAIVGRCAHILKGNE